MARGKNTGTLYMTSCPRDTIAVVDASTDTSLWSHEQERDEDVVVKRKITRIEVH